MDSVLAQCRHRHSSAAIGAEQGEDSGRIVPLDASRSGQLDGRGGGPVAHEEISLVVRLRQVRVAEVARTVRVGLGPGAIRSPGVQTVSGLNCQREPPRPAITSSTLLAYALPRGSQSARWSSALPVPPLG